jgi:RNA polymerase sigma-70 factor (ECF subfamily)
MSMARLNQPSDTSLAIRLQSGDIKALSQIIDKYQEPLLRYVRYLGAIHQDEDIVQETFIKAYQNINSFDKSRQLSSWLYRIAHNTAVSMLRTQRFALPWEDYLDRIIKSNPIDNFESDLKKEQVKKCLSQLPLIYREPLALHYLEEKSYLEIMDILRLPMGTVSARINRAKIQMRTLCQNK